jgi:N-acetylmuramoyl-L-alanine amidase
MRKSLQMILGLTATLAFTAGMASAQTKICIDPGHGGSDPGAVGGGQEEQANVLDTSNRLKAWLDLDTAQSGGGGSWSVFRTRTADVDVSLSGRTTYANNNAVARFMSIHNNAAAATSAAGIETFSVSSTGTGADLRAKVQEEAVAMWPLTNRGNKTANFYVLVNTSMPAELHEMAFITNTGDRTYLGSTTNRDNHAKSEMWGLQRHYGLAKYTPTTVVEVIADNGTAAWSASASWLASTSTSGYYGANYHYRNTAALSDSATWTANLPSAGSYAVAARWTAGTNRAASAPYIVTHTGGNTTVNANQQANNGVWMGLGTYSFAAGNNIVKLSCWTTVGYVVVGDAVRFTKI